MRNEELTVTFRIPPKEVSKVSESPRFDRITLLQNCVASFTMGSYITLQTWKLVERYIEILAMVW